jgi:2-polyprenyl-6-methoxyphenol hydroxylase-like FAD-dependent oxidoreductase
MATRSGRSSPPAAARRSLDVAIVGGGLGGLALAAALRRHAPRLSVGLYEAAPSLRTSTGTLIGLGGNSFSALEWIDPAIVRGIR